MLPVLQRISAIFSSLLSLRPTLLLFVRSFVCYLLSLFKICIYSQGGAGVCLLSCENKSSRKLNIRTIITKTAITVAPFASCVYR